MVFLKKQKGKKKLIKGHRGWEILESSKAEMQNITDKYNNKIKLTRNKKKKDTTNFR